ncbi:hypothetical protein [Dyella mobilis]|uniref:Uncharacterized protein n=1 Tax=Dyella mobilis TaxID=1849582 RepID=A0ABS2KCY5_9GAMM|nr:hypothetical protein [Dyella mobilis]MBM7128954.1 hypothetical protein [Dyella mobilis]GLQ99355.1 hypothetical protein GCM10007863_37750 [Dyella mobilis]
MAATASSIRKVLIIGLLQNDDGEMKEMADCFAEQVKLEGGTPVRADAKSSGDLAALVRKQGGTFSEVMFAGYSRFNTDANAPTRFDDRRLGGFPVPEVIACSWDCMIRLKVNVISFWCCEIATKRGAHIGSDEASAGSSPMYQGHLANIRRRIHEDKYAKVSTLEVICNELSILCQKYRINKSVTIRGLNGVGYITRKKGGLLDVKALDFQHVALIRKLNQLEILAGKGIKGKNGERIGKELAECEASLEKQLALKSTAHVISFDLNPDSWPMPVAGADIVVIEDEESA